MTNSPKDPLDGEAVVDSAQLLRTIQYSAPDVDAPPDRPDQQSFFARLGDQLTGQLAFPVMPKRVVTTVIHIAARPDVKPSE